MVKITTLTCKRCGHRWAPRTSKPVQCPACHSPKWNTLRLLALAVLAGVLSACGGPILKTREPALLLPWTVDNGLGRVTVMVEAPVTVTQQRVDGCWRRAAAHYDPARHGVMPAQYAASTLTPCLWQRHPQRGTP